MKTEKNILIAFLLNLMFSVFEFVGGVVTGSVAIMSDAIHDMGDATGIGISYFLEKKSKQQPDDTYTYGYVRYSLVGGLLNTAILLFGSVVVIVHAVLRLIAPVSIDYNGMLLFAVVGVLVNFVAAFVTRKGESLNQRAVNLHMIEDVLGWLVVLIGAIVMRFTDFLWLDPLMSIGVAAFILIHAVKNFKKVLDLFLEKIPNGVSVSEVIARVEAVEGVLNVHHLHVWSIDGRNHYATMHIVTNADAHIVKESIRRELLAYGIRHVTLELETEEEHCHEEQCRTEKIESQYHHHHHHH